MTNIISKICYTIGHIAKDKILHYLLSYIIFDTCLSLCSHFNLITWLTLTISIFIISIVIFGKEYIDEKEYNGWDWKDILAGYLGVITKLILFIIEII